MHVHAHRVESCTAREPEPFHSANPTLDLQVIEEPIHVPTIDVSLTCIVLVFAAKTSFYREVTHKKMTVIYKNLQKKSKNDISN